MEECLPWEILHKALAGEGGGNNMEQSQGSNSSKDWAKGAGQLDMELQKWPYGAEESLQSLVQSTADLYVVLRELIMVSKGAFHRVDLGWGEASNQKAKEQLTHSSHHFTSHHFSFLAPTRTGISALSFLGSGRLVVFSKENLQPKCGKIWSLELFSAEISNKQTKEIN